MGFNSRTVCRPLWHREDYENYNRIGNQFKDDIKSGKATEEEFDKWLDTQDKTKKQD